MTLLRVWSLKCLNYGFWTPEFLVTVSNIKVDIFSYNNKRINLCRRGGGCIEIVFLAGFRKSAPGLKPVLAKYEK